MRRFDIRSSVALGCFALLVLSPQLIVGQSDSDERPQRLLQSAADIAALPPSDRSGAVRAGFTPAQSNSNTGYRSSFYQQQTSSDVYPYPTSDRPRSGASSQSAFALSQGASGGRLSNQISIGSNTSTGDLGNDRHAMSSGFSNARSNSNNRPRSVYNINANSRTAVEQQRSSTLNPVAQARINQTAVDRLRSQQDRTNSNQELRASGPPERSASRNNLFNQYGQSGLSQPRTAFRQAAFQPNQAAANCCTPNYNPVSAGYQGAAFQAPAINPTVGVGLGLGVPPLSIQNPAGVGGGFNQPALPQQQCCQPQAGYAGGVGGCQPGYQGTGYQGGYQFGAGVGTPQFGAQGARWWTPFVRGSGVYTPLLDLSPNNTGTYLGQGIIGQPTAYVNGQLLRNLLRYLSP